MENLEDEKKKCDYHSWSFCGFLCLPCSITDLAFVKFPVFFCFFFLNKWKYTYKQCYTFKIT